MARKRSNNLYRYIEIILTSLMLLLIMVVVTRHIDHTRALYVICPVLVALNCLRFKYHEQMRKIFTLAVRWRWVIAGIVFAILVVLGVHGSSMDAFNILCPTDPSSNSGVLFGTPRLIRTDEYVVQVPYFFSQRYNGYREISHQMSLSGQDMIIGYNSPVLDFTLIGKPFILGYILFGNARGLSWYWCSKIILALLAAFEMIRILTRNDKISVFGSILIVFSPAMQWWFAPHMYDVFFWSMALFDVGYYFFLAGQRLSRVLTSILAVSTMTGFVVALFPSLQVAVGLCVFVLLIACLIRDKDQITFHKTDCIRLATVIMIVLGILGHWILTAKEAIKILSNTAYPGKRISVGGDFGLDQLFTNINSLLTAFYTPAKQNASEISSFIHLGLLSFFLYPYFWKREHKDRSLVVGGAFFAILLVQIEFMLVGFPKWLAKITLFSYINRMNLAYGFASALSTCWTMAYVFSHREVLHHWYPPLAFIAYTGLYYLGSRSMHDEGFIGTRLGSNIYIVSVLFFGALGMFLILGWKRYMMSFLTLTVIISGMFVNPVCQGIAPITDHDYVRAAATLNKEDKGAWITVGTSWEQNLLLANGLQTLNAVNYYPDFPKWQAIDPDGDYLKEYNRYAHISIFLSENGNKLMNPALDSVTLQLDVNEVSKFGAKYVLSSDQYNQLLDKYTNLFEKCYSGKGYCIYKVK